MVPSIDIKTTVYIANWHQNSVIYNQLKAGADYLAVVLGELLQELEYSFNVLTTEIGIAIEDKISNVIGLLLLIVNFIIFKIV